MAFCTRFWLSSWILCHSVAEGYSCAKGLSAATSVNSWCSALVSTCCGGSSVCFNCPDEAVTGCCISGSVSQWSLMDGGSNFSCCRFVLLNRCPWKSSVTMWQVALVLWCREASDGSWNAVDALLAGLVLSALVYLPNLHPDVSPLPPFAYCQADRVVAAVALLGSAWLLSAAHSG
ncbi:hypothetical protein Nepgr_033654 [Nepenthes gracilis]|uniref:Secreted protein n=1 Tax=Nepenthes gracilis TaxID=150966 RepID=A0AAD3TLK0_NEPGR|nr:hypothetical protein Nepgr_033654 [Nepenthes gracilis]